jgi:hypothetical protein
MLTDTQVIFVPDLVKHGSEGYLLFGRNSTLLALRFDAERLDIAGNPCRSRRKSRFSNHPRGPNSMHRLTVS